MGSASLEDGLGEEELSETSQYNKVQPVLSQICGYRPLSVN